MITERIVRAGRSAVPTPGDGSLVAPFQFVLGGTEHLRVTVLADSANTAIFVQGRMLRPDGTIAPFSFRIRSGLALVTVIEDFQLGAGALLTVFALSQDASGSNEWGDTYVSLSIVQGRDDAAVELGVLAQSYIAFKMPVVWPGTPFRSSLEGPGKPHREVLPGTSGVGPYVFTGTVGYRIRVSALKFFLAADATPGARRAVVELSKGATVIGSFAAPATQAAGVSRLHNCLPGGTDADTSAASRQTIALPQTYFLEGADSISIEWGAPGGANDTLNNVVLYGERWLVLPGLGVA